MRDENEVILIILLSLFYWESFRHARTHAI